MPTSGGLRICPATYIVRLMGGRSSGSQLVTGDGLSMGAEGFAAPRQQPHVQAGSSAPKSPARRREAQNKKNNLPKYQPSHALFDSPRTKRRPYTRTKNWLLSEAKAPEWPENPRGHGME